MASPSKKTKYQYEPSDFVDRTLVHQVAKYVKHDRLGDLAKYLYEQEAAIVGGATSEEQIKHVSIYVNVYSKVEVFIQIKQYLPIFRNCAEVIKSQLNVVICNKSRIS